MLPVIEWGGKKYDLSTALKPKSKQTFEPDNVNCAIGFDAEGTACVFFQLIDDDGNHVRYLTEEEIREVAGDLFQ